MRKYDTCFFERYAQISLETLLGREFANLVNEDRPDLQSPDGVTLGIEVTRAMEQSKDAARILESGYGYGLSNGRFIGCLHVCNLSDSISDSSRVLSVPVPQEMRKTFYLESLWEK